MKAITTTNLTKKFADLTAVDGISFSVNSGEVFGFLGPNGAGKTTTIRMLTGQLLPSSGQATVAGFDIHSERECLKPKIGVIFEFQNLYERLSAKDNLNFMRQLYGVEQARVDQVLDQVGLKDRANEKLKNYSNGMKQRLLIARALLHEPEILFMDEPTRGLDPVIALQIRQLISQLALEGRTIFLTTHYMEEADRLCDRVAIINHGRVIALDTPLKLKENFGPTLEDAYIELTGHSMESSVLR
jgi:ABC-2 type transport system ATP-binding protein